MQSHTPCPSTHSTAGADLADPMAALTPQARALSILYVEDDEASRRWLGRALAQMVREVHLATDGVEGLALFREKRPDLVLSDVRMPRFDGLAMCESIRAMDARVPIVFVSAHDEKEYLKRALACGALAFLEKPLDLGEVARILSKVAQNRARSAPALAPSEDVQEELAQAVELLNRGSGGLPDADVRVWTQAASQVNGDLVCHARGPRGDLFVLLADAIGHGLPAAITGMPLPALFTNLVAQGYSLYTVLEHLNRHLHTQHAHQFVAAAGIRFDPRRNQLEVANCGLPDLYLVREEGEIERRFPSINLPLGILPPDVFNGDSEQAHIGAASHLYLISDGVTDARDANDQGFGEGELARHLTHPAASRFETLIAGLRAHVGEQGWIDDCTIVEVRLTPSPEAAEAAPATTEADTRAPLLPSTRLNETILACSVLLIEDDSASRELIERYLRKRIGTVLVAEDFAQGLATFEQHRPDLVVCDIHLPGGNGLKLLARLREIDPVLPLIVISAYSEPQFFIDAIELRVLRFLPKPVNLDRLEEAIYAGLRESLLRHYAKLEKDAFEEAPEAIVVTDAQQNILAINRAFTLLTGYTPDEVIGRTPRILNSGRQDRLFYENMLQTIQAGHTWRGEIWNRRKDGKHYLEELEIRPILGEDGKPRSYLGIFRDITRHKANEARIQQLAFHDALTGLPNRSLLIERINQAIGLAHRDGERFALMLIDLDRFKNINDTLGHAAGDRLIVQTGERIAACLREGDTLARVGGDEFMVLMRRIDHREDAGRLARKILNTLAKPFLLQGEEVRIGSTIGISVYPNDATDADTLMRHADIAMYRGKEERTASFRFYSEEMNRRIQNKMQLENRMRRAIENDGFQLYYQPKYALSDLSLTSAEALLRWQEDDGTLLAPAQFIPIAEETGLIIPLGEWVLHELCRQMQEWEQVGLAPVPVAFNLSSRQLYARNLARTILETIRCYDLPPQQVEIELTESALVHGIDDAMELILALRAHGIRVALDDFGSGYSSLGYLKELPLDILKIDRAFVQDIDHSPANAAIVEAIAAMAKALNLHVIAEGIETESQLERLRASGCNEGQGYLFARPLSAMDFAKLLAKRKSG